MDFGFSEEQNDVRQLARQILSEQVTPEPVLDEAQKAKVESLLAGAQRDIQADRLTSPRGNNAVERLREVLSIHPDNREAVAGLEHHCARAIAE